MFRAPLVVFSLRAHQRERALIYIGFHAAEEVDDRLSSNLRHWRVVTIRKGEQQGIGSLIQVDGYPGGLRSSLRSCHKVCLVQQKTVSKAYLHLMRLLQREGDCPSHSIGNGSKTRASVISGPCFPSRIASTISGASSVSRRTRVM